MCTINRRTYSCSVPVENGVCGETKTLDIIHEFKRLYEEKMHEIDNSNCEDCLQEKIKLQQDWIGDLTEQNEMLVRAVEELEQEATERVKMLEEKLQRSAQCISEVMQKYREHDITEIILEESRQRIFNLENDLKNMLELVRRLRDDNELSLGGLTFYDITRKELLGDKTEGCILSDLKKADMTNQEQISAIQSLESKLEDCERITKAKQEECENLQRNMIDMRQALTEEVATKHDAILKLKRECQELEERCIQADKQTAFRDDIIKELRKEIKQLKQQENDVLKEDSIKLKRKVMALENEVEVIKFEIQSSLDCLDKKLNETETTNLDYIKKQLKIINESSVDNLYSFMENEIIQLNKLIDAKQNQLQEIFILNQILIKKLFTVDVELRYLEERAYSARFSSLEYGKRMVENENNILKKDKQTLEKSNLVLEEKFKETKQQVQTLENQFNTFLQEKQQLKEKYKKTAEQGVCLAKQCTSIECENKRLKEQTEKLRIELEKCNKDKCRLVQQMNELSQNFEKEKCSCKKDRKLTENLFALKEENRSLLQTLDSERNKIDLTSSIAQEEVEKLQKTIDELRNTLEESRRLQEVEEKERCSEILELKERIKELEGCLCDANEKVKEEVSKLATLNKKVKELEQCLCDAKEKAKEEVSKIVTLNQTVKELEQCLCDVEEKAKGKESENIALNNKIKELECYLCEANEQIKNDQACKTLRERIKELELALNDAKGKMKVCKLCKHSIRVGFSDNSEVQTDEVNQEQIEKLIERDELIKFQAKTLKMLQQELDNFQKKEKAWLVDKEKSEKNCNEVQCLQKHIVGLNEQLLKFGKKIDELNETVKSKEDFIKTQKEAFNCLEKELDSIKSKETELREESQQQIVGLKEQLLKFEKKVDELNETVKSKEDVIKTQKEALNCVEKELNSIRSKETELREENQQQNASIRKLKCKIKEMETTALDAERRASNLQTAVDLYTNTINVLEGNEEKYKLEIENQRTTIINLQEAIVATKNELDSAKQKYNDSVSVGWTSRWFGLSESKPTDNNQTPVHDI